jgi:transcriptional regulator GlxA family with amidase domain
MREKTSIGMLLFPQLTILDLIGPYEVFSRMPNVQIQLVAATLEPVVSEKGLTIIPDTPIAGAPPFDVLFVPGGNGVNAMLEDEQCLAFLALRSGRPAARVPSDDPLAQSGLAAAVGSRARGRAGRRGSKSDHRGRNHGRD